MKKIGILGSTGSIGTQALQVINNQSNYEVEYLSCFSQIDKMIEHVQKFHPKKVCVIDKEKESILVTKIKYLDVFIQIGMHIEKIIQVLVSPYLEKS